MLTADSTYTADSLLTADGLLPSVLTGQVSVQENYRGQLAALLPTGLAWPAAPDSTLQRLLAGWAESFARIDARAQELVAESDPRAALALLPDWARVAGVPDACVDDAPTNDALRAQLLRRLTQINSATPAYFIELAAAFGFVITITEYTPTTVEDDVDADILEDPWAHAWQVNAALNGDVVPINVEDDVEALLETWNNNDALECLMERSKPAHTTINYSYS